MNLFNKTALTLGIAAAIFGTVACIASPNYLQLASNEVFASDESSVSNLYQKGQKAMDKGDWKKAIKYFDEMVNNSSNHTDAALYWRGYSEFRLGKKSAANRSLRTLLSNHKNSQWINEAKSLLAEIKGVDAISDDELKEIALISLTQASPERAIPILKKILASNSSADIKENALFVLSQLGTKEALKLIVSLAMDSENPVLQRDAIQVLGIWGDKNSQAILAELWKTKIEPIVREAIMEVWMITKNIDALFLVAQTSENREERKMAIEFLGALGAQKSLQKLYKNETDIVIKQQLVESLLMTGDMEMLTDIIENETNEELLTNAITLAGSFGKKEVFEKLSKTYHQTKSNVVKKAIIEAWMINQNSKRLVELLATESDKSLQVVIVEMLGIINDDISTAALNKLYKKSADVTLKSIIIDSYMIQGKTIILIEIFKTEKNQQLRRQAIRNLSTMDSKEAQELMLELLEKG